MPQILHLQPAGVVDHITDDGTELTKQPYPFDVVLADSRILNQKFWRGSPKRLVGFQDDPAVNEVSLSWTDIDPADTDALIGKYIVTVDGDSSWSTSVTAVERVEVFDISDERLTAMGD